VEYEYPFGWGELEGIAKRGSFDLTQHSKGSGKEQSFFDEEAKQHYIPHVVEPAAGCDRAAITFLIDAYEEQDIGKDGVPDLRTVLHLHPLIAPVSVAVFPLVKKEGMPERARSIVAQLREAGIRCVYDEKGAIGRRYRRQDEVGTPWCVTVDGETLADGTVTVRDRDTMAQERVAQDGIEGLLRRRIKEWSR
jgi:glycyl-tRNA synthetase